MKNNVVLLLALLVLLSASSFNGKAPGNYKAQIPGRIECEFFDAGGEGIAYHDTDSINNGSGKLNPANEIIARIQDEEAVDISYTKTGGIDNNPYNKTVPDSNQLYVGWTVPGEWLNYTVEVNETASYKFGIMYTANGDGSISLDLDGQALTGNLKIISTRDDRDSIAWRQWHHWNKIDSLTNIKIEKGVHKLTLHIVEHGQMNFDYMEFNKE